MSLRVAQIVRVVARTAFLLAVLTLIIGVPIGDRMAEAVVLGGGLACAIWLVVGIWIDENIRSLK